MQGRGSEAVPMNRFPCSFDAFLSFFHVFSIPSGNIFNKDTSRKDIASFSVPSEVTENLTRNNSKNAINDEAEGR